MTSPKLTVLRAAADQVEADVLVVGALSGSTPILHAAAGFEELSNIFDAVGVTGASDQLVRLPALAGRAKSIAVIGIGKTATTDALRNAAGSAIRQLAGNGSVALAIPAEDAADVAAILEGAALGAYAYTEYRGTTAETVKAPVAEVTVITSLEVPAALAERAAIVADAVALVRDLGNAPASALYPETLAAAASDAVAELPVEVTVWDEEALERDGFGGILGVGKGSERGPRLVKLSYSPEGASKHVALVGKGITFDTGGLSLKPAAAMIGMKYDMLGAAAVLGTIVAASRLGLPVRLTGWLCIAENMPSGRAARPNDVFHIRGGRTVEVLNTDAEGRLVMADGLVAASEEHPDAIIDVATLTGAAIVSLGRRYTGVMGNDDLATRVVDIASSVGEKFWRMPLPEELRTLLNSDIADIANVKMGNTSGGMLVAAHFLQEFIGTVSEEDGAPRIPWAHLDIAGPGDNPEGAYGHTPKGATGVSVRTLIAVAEEYSRA